MKKDIKDYLHFYLGSWVLIEKSNYYFVHELNLHQGETFLLSGFYLGAISDHGNGLVIKLKLRPLPSMTEQEAVEMASLTEWEPHFRDVKVERNKITNDIIVTWDGANESRDMVNATGDLFWCYEQFMWFLKKEFDIFELIEEGLAIDKTKISV